MLGGPQTDLPGFLEVAPEPGGPTPQGWSPSFHPDGRAQVATGRLPAEKPECPAAPQFPPGCTRQADRGSPYPMAPPSCAGPRISLRASKVWARQEHRPLLASSQPSLAMCPAPPGLGSRCKRIAQGQCCRVGAILTSIALEFLLFHHGPELSPADESPDLHQGSKDVLSGGCRCGTVHSAATCRVGSPHASRFWLLHFRGSLLQTAWEGSGG